MSANENPDLGAAAGEMGMSECDLVIGSGAIVDGAGVPRYQADLAIKDKRIAKISGRIAPGAAREVDAAGCLVAPGAIAPTPIMMPS